MQQTDTKGYHIQGININTGESNCADIHDSYVWRLWVFDYDCYPFVTNLWQEWGSSGLQCERSVCNYAANINKKDITSMGPCFFLPNLRKMWAAIYLNSVVFWDVMQLRLVSRVKMSKKLLGHLDLWRWNPWVVPKRRCETNLRCFTSHKTTKLKCTENLFIIPEWSAHTNPEKLLLYGCVICLWQQHIYR